MKPCIATPLAFALLVCGHPVLAGTPDTHPDTVTTLSPTTGLPTDKPYRPVLVQISNGSGARPPLNLAAADIVYEFVIMAIAHTRYLAVYNDQHPSIVRSVRSIRINSAELREAWDCPLVFWSWSGNDYKKLFEMQNVLKDMLVTIVHSSQAAQAVLFRTKDRVLPHNAAVDLERYVAEYWPADPETGDPYAPRLPGLLFSNTPTKGDEPATRVEVPYHEEEFFPSYTYNEAIRAYERWYNSEPQVDGQIGERITASNVIVQYTAVWYYKGDRSAPMVQTIGAGPIDAFIDGRHIRGNWRRANLESQTEYLDGDGNPLVLLPGKTFIQLFPPTWTITYSDENENTH